MSEAEEKWENWDLHFLFIQYTKGTEPGYKYFEKSREAYKAALRREIEKRIEQWKNSPQMNDLHLSMADELEEILLLLDTVEP